MSRLRTPIITASFALAAVATVLVTLGSGPLPVPPGGVVRAILGESDSSTSFAIMDVSSWENLYINNRLLCILEILNLRRLQHNDCLVTDFISY